MGESLAGHRRPDRRESHSPTNDAAGHPEATVARPLPRPAGFGPRAGSAGARSPDGPQLPLGNGMLTPSFSSCSRIHWNR